MPKIPWTPPARPPRDRTVYKPPSIPCSTCGGNGILYRNSPTSNPLDGEKIDCWVCKGTGEQLPPPPDGDLHSTDPPAWTGDPVTPLPCPGVSCSLWGQNHVHSPQPYTG